MINFNAGSPAKYTVQNAPDGFAVCQNAMALETPGGAPLVVPSAPLAEAVMEEFLSRAGKRDPGRAPLTQLAYTAIDVIRPSRDDVIRQILSYGESELLCHRADGPRHLMKEQQKVWQPLLDWCAKRFKAPLNTAVGVMPIAQPEESLEGLRQAVEQCNDFYLVGLMQAVSASGSLVLGLALAFQQLTATQVYEASELDATFQAEKWGDDPEASIRHDSMHRELMLCGRWFSTLGLIKAKESGAYDPASGY